MYDGTIKINTKLDQAGFNEGVKNMTGSIDKLKNVITGLGAAWLALVAGQTIFSNLLSGLQNYQLFWSSMGNQIWDLNWAFQNLQGSWANLLATAIEPMIPYIIQIVQWLQGLVQYVTVLIAAFFGLNSTVGNLLKKTGALAAFDKINVLSKNIGPAASPPPITVPQDLIDKMNALKKAVMDILNPFLIPFVQAWKIWGQWIKDNPKTISNLAIGLAAIGIALWLIFTPLGLITLLIVGLIALAVLLTLHWEGLKTTVYQLGIVWWYALTHPFEGLNNSLMTALKVIAIVIAGIILFVAGVPLAIIAAIMIVIIGIGLLFTHFGGIKEFFRGLANGIIDFLNTIARAWAGFDNFLINSMNKVGSVMPGYKPIPNIAALQIPHLATGAVIPPNSRFLAMLGDQKSGTNIEAPASLIRQIVREEIGNANQSMTVTVKDQTGLMKYLKVGLDRENLRVGQSLVKRTGAAVQS